MGLDLVITDDILLGKINLSSTQTKIKTRSQQARDPNTDDQSDGSQELGQSFLYDDAASEKTAQKSSAGRLSAQENQDKKVSKQLGLRLKFKKQDFVFYMRKHPLYNAMGAEQLSKLKDSVHNSKSPISRKGSEDLMD